jgi:hypothetical protein
MVAHPLFIGSACDLNWLHPHSLLVTPSLGTVVYVASPSRINAIQLKQNYYALSIGDNDNLACLCPESNRSSRSETTHGGARATWRHHRGQPRGPSSGDDMGCIAWSLRARTDCRWWGCQSRGPLWSARALASLQDLGGRLTTEMALSNPPPWRLEMHSLAPIGFHKHDKMACTHSHKTLPRNTGFASSCSPHKQHLLFDGPWCLAILKLEGNLESLEGSISFSFLYIANNWTYVSIYVVHIVYLDVQSGIIEICYFFHATSSFKLLLQPIIQLLA